MNTIKASITAAAVAWGLLLCAPMAAHAVNATLSDDAYTQSPSGTGTNYGVKKDLRVQGPPASNTIWKSFIQFDMSTLPSGTTSSDVSKATLKLFVNKVTAAGSFEVHVVNTGWTEPTITGASSPTIGALIAVNPTVAVTTASKGEFVTVDLTAEVMDWIDTPSSNHGIALVASGAVGV